jgi:hypothetical protein
VRQLELPILDVELPYQKISDLLLVLSSIDHRERRISLYTIRRIIYVSSTRSA